MKCSKRKCPMQHNTIPDDCNLDDCPYRTEDVEPQEVIRALCNYIADLVVQKLKAESVDKFVEKVIAEKERREQ